MLSSCPGLWADTAFTLPWLILSLSGFCAIMLILVSMVSHSLLCPFPLNFQQR